MASDKAENTESTADATEMSVRIAGFVAVNARMAT